MVHVLHAIHDFLPRHRAGSELYALALAQAQLTRQAPNSCDAAADVLAALAAEWDERSLEVAAVPTRAAV